MYIYADILIIVNIYIDFILINAVRYLTHSKLKTSRALIAAFIGSLFSLLIFARLPYPVIFLINILSSVLIVFTAFGYTERMRLLKQAFIFLISSFILSGTADIISRFSSTDMVISRNGIIYADFSPSALIISSAAAYAAIALYSRITSRYAVSGSYTIIIRNENKMIGIDASADTGNYLRDVFSGKPVIVCSRRSVSDIYPNIPETDSYENIKAAVKWHFIPLVTAAGRSVIPVTSPDDIEIKDNSTGKIYPADACIGISDSNMTAAVFNPELLF